MDDLCKAEQAKYARIWERPEYRRHSPGEVDAPRALKVCEMQVGDSLTDFGAGTGRATAWFAEQGLEVLAVDFVAAALEADVPFKTACLWQMGRTVRKADYGYCCDVMEHIPRERVDDVLAAIAKRTRRGCYFRIATRPDVCGQLIGETLHLTVEGAAWWRDRLLRGWNALTVVEEGPGALVVWAEP